MPQLRCGILPIRIETGRYDPKPLKAEEHICQHYLSEPETEVRLFFHLDHTKIFKRKVLSEVHAVEPMFVMSNINVQFYIIKNHPNIIRKTATFIVNCLKTRSDILFNGE